MPIRCWGRSCDGMGCCFSQSWHGRHLSAVLSRAGPFLLAPASSVNSVHGVGWMHMRITVQSHAYKVAWHVLTRCFTPCMRFTALAASHLLCSIACSITASWDLVCSNIVTGVQQCATTVIGSLDLDRQTLFLLWSSCSGSHGCRGMVELVCCLALGDAAKWCSPGQSSQSVQLCNWN